MVVSVKIGNVEVSSSHPRIVANVGSNNAKKMAKEAELQGADIIELRCDLFKESDPSKLADEVAEIRKSVNIPLLATVRRVEDGGLWYKYKGTEKERLKIFQKIMGLVDAVDIEFGSEIRDDVLKEAKERNIATIISHHDFYKTEGRDEIMKIIDQMHSTGGDVLKISCMATNEQDTRTLLQVLLDYLGNEKYEKPISMISMGDYGQVSRIVFPGFGSSLTYGYVSGNGLAQAPGQYKLSRIRQFIDRFKKDIPISLTSDNAIQKIKALEAKQYAS